MKRAGLAAAVVTAAVFWACGGFGFVNWDDDKLLLANPHFRGLAWANLRWMLTSFHTGPYQPLSWLSYAVDFELWGLDPRGYHLTNVLLHALNAALFAGVARRVLRREDGAGEAAALVAALVFALHPLRAESVAWVTERRDVLAGAFYLGAVILYLDGKTRPALLTFALSLLAKGMGLTLPLTLLILEPKRRKELWPFAALALAAGAAGVWGQRLSGSLELAHAGLGLRLLQAGWSGSFYLGKTLWPVGLIPTRELLDYAAPGALRPGALAFLAASALAWTRRSPAFTKAWLCHVIAFLPVAGLWRFGPLIAADRYSYFIAMPWAVLAGGLWLAAWDRARGARREALGAATAGGLLLLGLSGLAQALVWRDSQALWEHTLSVDPGNAAAHNNLGTFLLGRGLPGEALAHLDASAAARPDFADAQHNRAVALAELGRDEEAEAAGRRGLALRPDPDAWVNLGLLLSRRGREGEAAAAYAKALRLEPRHAKAHNNLAALLLARGRLPEAEAHFREALRLRPGYEPALRGLELSARLRASARR